MTSRTTPHTATRSIKTPRPRFLLAIAAVAAIAATAGCAGSGSDGDSSSDSKRAESASVAGSAPDQGSADRDYAADSDEMRAGVEAPAPNPSAAADKPADQIGDNLGNKKTDAKGPAVISTGSVSLESKDVADARLEVRKILDKYRGTVTEQETTTGEKGEVTNARLALRVPSERFTDALKELEGVATFIDSSSSGQDVSTEVVDVEARIRAQRKSVNRIEALLARAESLEQIVTIESQLSSRQADLDALLSRQTYLADQTAQSTINVYIQQTDNDADEPEEEGAGGFVGGLHDGWDSFVTGFSAVLTVVGFLLPWLVLLVLIGIPARLLLKRRPRATA